MPDVTCHIHLIGSHERTDDKESAGVDRHGAVDEGESWRETGDAWDEITQEHEEGHLTRQKVDEEEEIDRWKTANHDLTIDGAVNQHTVGVCVQLGRSVKQDLNGTERR